MSSMSDLRFHIKSVAQTRQITNAMRLVSAARMRRSLDAIERNQAYFYRALDIISEISSQVGDIEHPYIHHRPGNRVAYVIVAGDKGLSGSYNHDILALADSLIEVKQAAYIFSIGRVTTLHYERADYTPDVRFEDLAEDPQLDETRKLATVLIELYDEDKIDELRIVYTHFINTLTHEPRDQRLLPVAVGDFQRPEGLEASDFSQHSLYEPSTDAVLSTLIPQLIIGFLYGAMVHAHASENCARMTAMENATQSADDLIAKLDRQFNTERQLSITNELADIMGAANAAKRHQYDYTEGSEDDKR